MATGTFGGSRASNPFRTASGSGGDASWMLGGGSSGASKFTPPSAAQLAGPQAAQQQYNTQRQQGMATGAANNARLLAEQNQWAQNGQGYMGRHATALAQDPTAPRGGISFGRPNTPMPPNFQTNMTSQPSGAPQPQGMGAPPGGGIFPAGSQPNAGIRPASQGPPITPIGSPSQAPPPGMAFSQSPSPPGTPALPGQSGPPPASAGPVGGSGDMYDVRTSIRPTTLFSPEQTQRSINQDAERMFTQADTRSLLPGAQRQGMSTGAGTLAQIAPQQGALEGGVLGSLAFRPMQDELANQQFLLKGQAAQGAEGLAMADLLRRTQASQDYKKNWTQSQLLSLLGGLF